MLKPVATGLRSLKSAMLALSVVALGAAVADAYEGIGVSRTPPCHWAPMAAKAWNGVAIKARVCRDENGDVIELYVPPQGLDVSSRWVSRLFGFSSEQCQSSVDMDTVMPSMFCATKRATMLFSEAGSPGLIAAWARKSFAR